MAGKGTPSATKTTENSLVAYRVNQLMKEIATPFGIISTLTPLGQVDLGNKASATKTMFFPLRA
jgi:hypothetical protein